MQVFAVLLLKAQWASKVDRMSNIPVGLVPVLAGDYCTKQMLNYLETIYISHYQDTVS